MCGGAGDECRHASTSPRRGSIRSLKKDSSDCLGRITGSETGSSQLRRGSLTPFDSRVTECETEDDQASNAGSETAEGLDWAAECLMLTHEPIRGDLTAIESAAKRIALDETPEEWRVRCFFQFFDDFCSLISQFFAVEIHVHCDWLCAEGETGEQLTSGHIVAADYRIELMRQHRELEELMTEVASLEGALMGRDADIDVMGRKPAVSAATARTAPTGGNPGARGARLLLRRRVEARMHNAWTHDGVSGYSRVCRQLSGLSRGHCVPCSF